MAAEKTTDYNAQPPAEASANRRGGTQGGEAARGIDPRAKESGTRGMTSPAGGVTSPPPAQAIPNTRPQPEQAGEQVARFVRGIDYPALKDTVVRHVRQAGAPNGIVATLENIPVTQFDSAEHVLRAYAERGV